MRIISASNYICYFVCEQHTYEITVLVIINYRILGMCKTTLAIKLAFSLH